MKLLKLYENTLREIDTAKKEISFQQLDSKAKQAIAREGWQEEAQGLEYTVDTTTGIIQGRYPGANIGISKIPNVYWNSKIGEWVHESHGSEWEEIDRTWESDTRP